MLQRVEQASVRVEGEVVGSIGAGLLALVGVTHSDRPADATVLADKIVGLRVFADEELAMNRSVVDTGGAVLVVSQFTLYADGRKGRRPSLSRAAHPDVAEPLVEMLGRRVEAAGVTVEWGRFGAEMAVELVNQGPVTVMLETVEGRLV